MSEQSMINQTSSISANWPPTPATHNRIRGFYNQTVLHSEADIAEFASEFDRYLSDTLAHPEIDRLSIRAVAASGAIATLDYMGLNVEATLPITGSGGELMVVYTGWNDPVRLMSEAYIARHRELLATAVARGRDTRDRVGELLAQGFVPRLIDRHTSEAARQVLVPAFHEMYAAFGYDQSDVEDLLMNPDNTIAYVRNGIKIVSTGMAERASVDVEGAGTVNLVEITEASTQPAYRGRGLYKAVSGFLINQILEASGQQPVGVLYGESNLAMPGVVIAAYENGRNFSHFNGPALGIQRPDFGFLPQNFRVNDGVEQRPYNDFALSYVTLE